MREDSDTKRKGRSVPRSRAVQRLVAGVSLLAVLLVFFSVVSWVTLSLRSDIREQLMSRDAGVLDMLIRHEIRKAENEYLMFEFETLDAFAQWEVLLETSSAEGIFAVQLFDTAGGLLQTTSDQLLREGLGEQLLQKVETQGPQAVYREAMPLSDIIDLATIWDDRDIAVLSLYLPLVQSDGKLLGVGVFLLDGSDLEQEFSELDEQLLRQASIASGLGAALIVLLFGGAWWLLDRANARVKAQAERLKRSNAELAMLARTSAVGSVAAHLIHGLKNPLAGLRAVVSGDYRSGGLESDDWEGAREAANRMQTMVQEVVALLQDSSATGGSYDLNLAELLDVLRERLAELGKRGDVDLRYSHTGELELDSHRANVVMLILSNLAQNAVEAVGSGGSVELSLHATDAGLLARVRDDGPGIPEQMREGLFSPVSSRKEGGAGIGLAISRQLALHLGGELRCLENLAVGACFELEVPLADEEVGI